MIPTWSIETLSCQSIAGLGFFRPVRGFPSSRQHPDFEEIYPNRDDQQHKRKKDNTATGNQWLSGDSNRHESVACRRQDHQKHILSPGPPARHSRGALPSPTFPASDSPPFSAASNPHRSCGNNTEILPKNPSRWKQKLGKTVFLTVFSSRPKRGDQLPGTGHTSR